MQVAAHPNIPADASGPRSPGSTSLTAFFQRYRRHVLGLAILVALIIVFQQSSSHESVASSTSKLTQSSSVYTPARTVRRTISNDVTPPPNPSIVSSNLVGAANIESKGQSTRTTTVLSSPSSNSQPQEESPPTDSVASPPSNPPPSNPFASRLPVPPRCWAECAKSQYTGPRLRACLREACYVPYASSSGNQKRTATRPRLSYLEAKQILYAFVDNLGSRSSFAPAIDSVVAAKQLKKLLQERKSGSVPTTASGWTTLPIPCNVSAPNCVPPTSTSLSLSTSIKALARILPSSEVDVDAGSLTCVYGGFTRKYPALSESVALEMMNNMKRNESEASGPGRRRRGRKLRGRFGGVSPINCEHTLPQSLFRWPPGERRRRRERVRNRQDEPNQPERDGTTSDGTAIGEIIDEKNEAGLLEDYPSLSLLQVSEDIEEASDDNVNRRNGENPARRARRRRPRRRRVRNRDTDTEPRDTEDTDRPRKRIRRRRRVTRLHRRENHAMRTDLHHMFPVHKQLNRARSNLPFGEVNVISVLTKIKKEAQQLGEKDTDVTANSEGSREVSSNSNKDEKGKKKSRKSQGMKDKTTRRSVVAQLLESKLKQRTIRCPAEQIEWWRGEGEANSDDAEKQADGWGRFSKKYMGKWEPRSKHKGNVARSLAYMYTMYEPKLLEIASAIRDYRQRLKRRRTRRRPNSGGYETPRGARSRRDRDTLRRRRRDRRSCKRAPRRHSLILTGRIVDIIEADVLHKWHLSDPADELEKERSAKVEVIQGTPNPYVEEPSLLVRAFPVTELRTHEHELAAQKGDTSASN